MKKVNRSDFSSPSTKENGRERLYFQGSRIVIAGSTARFGQALLEPIATIGFTLVLKSIQKEVESRESIDNGSGLGVFLPGCPGETGLFKEEQENQEEHNMLRTKRFLFMSWLLALLIVFVGVTRIQAQSILDGKLTGTITDDKGEPLPGVAVEVTSPASFRASGPPSHPPRGTYVFLNLPVGNYKLSASMPNFKTVVQENIVITVGSSSNVNLALEMGAIEETVTVIAASPIVDAKTSTVDSKLEKQMLAKLPTSRDAFYDLSLTTPGMFDHGSSGGWLPSPTAYSGASNENVFLVNGVNATNPRGSSFGPLVQVNYNAVEEVRVVALGSKAEYGSFSGAAIDVLTKSGSNAFHGNAAFYFEPVKWRRSNQPTK